MIYVDKAHDLALLKVQRLQESEEFTPVEQADLDKDTKTGTQFFACGFGGSEKLHCSIGTAVGAVDMIAKEASDMNGQGSPEMKTQPARSPFWLFELKQHTFVGDSGGPIFNMTGKVQMLVELISPYARITSGTPIQLVWVPRVVWEQLSAGVQAR